MPYYRVTPSKQRVVTENCFWQHVIKSSSARRTQMKAAVLREVNKPLEIEDVECNSPGPREVLIKTAAAGVCHSDLLQVG